MDSRNVPMQTGAPPQNLNLSQEQLLELEKQRDNNQYNIALKNLDASLRNQESMREVYYKGQRNTLFFLSAVALLIFIFFMVALYLNKDAFIADLIKIIMGGIGGAGAGYFAGFKRGRIEPPSMPPGN